MTLKHTSLHDFFRRQLGVWPDARQRFNDLQQVQTREAHFGNAVVMLQHNPGRMLSTNADMAKAICDKLGYKLEIDDMEFDSIITAVSKGKADFGAAGMTVTEDRKKNINFTDTYTKARQVIIVRKK